MKWDKATYTVTEPGRFGTLALIVGIVGLAASALGFFVNREQFFFSYLTAFVFWFSLGAGALFFTMLHHMTGATWSVAIRRLPEGIMMTLPVLAILFLPLLGGMHDLFHWTHAEAVAGDALLQEKAPYLNIPFFIIRAVIYFAVWTFLALMLRRLSLLQDGGHSEDLRRRLVRLSAPGLILFALTSTFAAFDWLMSLDPHWYSTIFGVYVFSGSVLGVLTLMILVLLWLRRQGVLADVVSGEHYHDLGKLTFAFMVFWGYMAFSQYFLIWYGNIPEETIWFLHRWEGSWKTWSLFIVFGNFVAPFFIMITRGAKRRLGMLGAIAGWLLFMHWVDIYWLVMPTLHHHGVHLSWLDVTTAAGIGGIFLWVFWTRFTARPLVPVGDPHLKASIDFVNH